MTFLLQNYEWNCSETVIVTCVKLMVKMYYMTMNKETLLRTWAIVEQAH